MGADPLSGRAEARELIRPELALDGNDLPLDVAWSVQRGWFDAVGYHVRLGRVVVCEWVAIGPPSPLLVEVTQIARACATAPPAALRAGERRVPVVVAASLGRRADRDCCVDWVDLLAELYGRHDRDRRVLRMMLRLEHLMALAADRARVGPAAVVSTWPSAPTGRPGDAASQGLRAS